LKMEVIYLCIMLEQKIFRSQNKPNSDIRQHTWIFS
jgi:hypothetical protein